MVRVIVVVREIGKSTPDFSLQFDLPEVPRIGSYISISGTDTPAPWSEDMVVRAVWWRLHHPVMAPKVTPEKIQPGSGSTLAGSPTEILVECEPAIGPNASDRWRDMLEAAERRGIKVERFDVERYQLAQ